MNVLFSKFKESQRAPLDLPRSLDEIDSFPADRYAAFARAVIARKNEYLNNPKFVEIIELMNQERNKRAESSKLPENHRFVSAVMYYELEGKHESSENMDYETAITQPAYHRTVRVPNLTNMPKPTDSPNVPNPMPKYFKQADIPHHGQYDPDPKEINAIFNRGIINRLANNFKPGSFKTFFGVTMGIGASVALYGAIGLLAPNPVKNPITRSKEWREATYERESKTSHAEFRALVELQRAIDAKHLNPKDL